jgi:hypothetical protein
MTLPYVTTQPRSISIEAARGQLKGVGIDQEIVMCRTSKDSKGHSQHINEQSLIQYRIVKSDNYLELVLMVTTKIY